MADGFGFRHAFGPGDITTVAILPDALFVLSEVADFSISTHFDKEPIRRLGHQLPQGWATGAGTVAGTLVCKQMTHAALWKVRRYAGTIRYSQEQGLLGSEETSRPAEHSPWIPNTDDPINDPVTIRQSEVNQAAASMLPQQLPPFHLMFVHQSQSGQMGLARLYDITFTDYSEVKGTTNSQTEETLQYQAQFYEQLRLRKSLTPQQMQEMAGQTLEDDSGAMWNDPRKPQMVDELMSLDSVENFGEYLIESTEDRIEATEDEDQASAQNIADTGSVVITETRDREPPDPPLEEPDDTAIKEDPEFNEDALQESKVLATQEIDFDYVTEENDSLTTKNFHGWVAHRRVQNNIQGSTIEDELRVTADGVTEEPDDWSSVRRISSEYDKARERFKLGDKWWIHKEIHGTVHIYAYVSVTEEKAEIWLKGTLVPVVEEAIPAPGTYKKNHTLFPEEINVTIDKSGDLPAPESTISDQHPPGGAAVKTASNVTYEPFEANQPGSISFDGNSSRIGYDESGPRIYRSPFPVFPYLGYAPGTDSFSISVVEPFDYSPSTDLTVDGTIDTTTDPNTYSVSLVNRGESVTHQGFTENSSLAGFSDAMKFKFIDQRLVVQAVVGTDSSGNEVFETVRIVATNSTSILSYQGSGGVKTLVKGEDPFSSYYLFDGATGDISEGTFRQHSLTEWLSVASESSLPSAGGSLTLPMGLSLPLEASAPTDTDWSLDTSNPVDISA